jgi:elongation factor P
MLRGPKHGDTQGERSADLWIEVIERHSERPMAQLNTSDFRKGSKVILDGEPYDMMEVNFVKPGKGQALYKCRLRNLLKGTILDRTYKSGDSLEAADIRTGEGQFMYKDPSGLVFMDPKSFDQFTIPNAVAGDQARFLEDNAVCIILFWGEQPIGMTAPDKVVMKVAYTEDVYAAIPLGIC